MCDKYHSKSSSCVESTQVLIITVNHNLVVIDSYYSPCVSPSQWDVPHKKYQVLLITQVNLQQSRRYRCEPLAAACVEITHPEDDLITSNISGLF
jgi:hypothetical protein